MRFDVGLLNEKTMDKNKAPLSVSQAGLTSKTCSYSKSYPTITM
jgi:hypothetical protein